MKKYENGKDNRPDPKPRKRPQLWQAYLIWDELVKMRQRHNLRLSSINAGKSNLDGNVETAFMSDIQLDHFIKLAEKQIIHQGEVLCPGIWEWVTSFRGLKAGSLAAQLLSQIDDIGKFSNVSKLWRFAGYAVWEGEREYRGKLYPGDEEKEESERKKSHYNTRLKSIVYLVVDEFIKQQTHPYIEIYYAEKLRIRTEHPKPEIENRPNTPFKKRYTDGHIHAMAMRKTGKIFLQHLWITWREAEGLPVTLPWIIDIGGHSDYIEPPAIEAM